MRVGNEQDPSAASLAVTSPAAVHGWADDTGDISIDVDDSMAGEELVEEISEGEIRRQSAANSP